MLFHRIDLEKVTLAKETWTVPASYPYLSTDDIVDAARGRVADLENALRPIMRLRTVLFALLAAPLLTACE